MVDVVDITSLGNNPITWAAAALFFHTLTGLVQSIKLKPKIEEHRNAHTAAHAEQLAALSGTVGEVAEVLKEVAKTVSDIASTQVDYEESEELATRQLERIIVLVRSLYDLHKDPNSGFSTIKVIEKEEEIIRMLNEVKLALARSERQ